MRFLIDEDLPRSTADIIRRYGHEPIDVRDMGLRGASDQKIAAHAKKEKLCLMTGDFDFSDIRTYPPSKFSGIVILSPEEKNATSQHFTGLLEKFLQQEHLIKKLPGHLVIAQPGRVRIRGDI